MLQDTLTNILGALPNRSHEQHRDSSNSRKSHSSICGGTVPTADGIRVFNSSNRNGRDINFIIYVILKKEVTQGNVE